jgi:hypothetical protein
MATRSAACSLLQSYNHTPQPLVARACVCARVQPRRRCRVVSLEQVCKLCEDPTQAVVSEITVGTKFKLQFCRAAAKHKGRFSSKAPSAAEAAARILDLVTLGGGAAAAFAVEAKFDGWRLCCHVGDASDASSILMYSRNENFSEPLGERYGFAALAPVVMAQVRAAIPPAVMCAVMCASTWRRRAGGSQASGGPDSSPTRGETPPSDAGDVVPTQRVSWHHIQGHASRAAAHHWPGALQANFRIAILDFAMLELCAAGKFPERNSGR